MTSLVALRSDWRREALRTNLWLVPTLEVVAAVALYFGTHALDKTAFDGDLTFPGMDDVQREYAQVLNAAKDMAGDATDANHGPRRSVHDFYGPPADLHTL